jgi:hypothetical protein
METAKRAQTLSPIVVWLAWTGGSFLAGVVALALSFGILRLVDGNEDRLAAPILITALVLLLGVAQALVLSMRLRRPWGWLGVSAAGCALAVLVFLLIAVLGAMGNLNPMGWTTTLTLIIFGACMGVVQWAYLRRLWSQAIWWIPASILGWALPGLLVGRAFTSPLQLTMLGIIPAAITGALVAWWFSGLDRP